MPDLPERSSNRQLYFLTFLHTVIDSYATLLPHLLPHLLPVLLTRLAAGTAARYTLAGALISVYNFFSALNQIFFGWLEDRVRSIHFLTLRSRGHCVLLVSAEFRAVHLGSIFAVDRRGHRRCGVSPVGDCPSRESRKAEPRVGSFNLSYRG